MPVRIVLKNALKIYLGKIIASFIANINFLILAKLMGKEEFGVFALVKYLLFVMVSLTNFVGVPNSLAYFTAKAHLSRKSMKKILLFIFGFGLMLIFPLYEIQLLLQPLLFSEISKFLLFLAACLVPVYLLQMALTGNFLGRGLSGRYTLSLVAMPAAFFLLSLSALLFRKSSSLDITVALFFSYIISLLICLYAYQKDKTIEHNPSQPISKNQLLKFGLAVLPASIMACLTGRTDRFIINKLLGASFVAEYSIAIALSEIALFISFALYGSIFKKVASQDEAHAKATVRKYLGYCLAFLVAFSIIYIPSALFLIDKFFGAKYENLRILFLLTYPGVAVVNFSVITDTFITGQLGTPILNFFFGLPAFICVILLNLIFIPRWGVAGAGAAISLSYFVMVSVYLVFLFTKQPRKLAEISSPADQGLANP